MRLAKGLDDFKQISPAKYEFWLSKREDHREDLSFTIVIIGGNKANIKIGIYIRFEVSTINSMKQTFLASDIGSP